MEGLSSSLVSLGRVSTSASSTQDSVDRNNRRIELVDLTARYPPQWQPNLQQILTAKIEYAELSSPQVEPMLRKKGCLFRHQLLFRRHLTHYPSCMVVHDTGTGKTCTISELVQYFREHPGEIRYSYILVSGPTQKLEFKKQLACVCTVGVYETESLKKSESTQGQQMAVSLEIKKWFKIKTYGSMASEIAEYSVTPEGNAALKRDYSGCIFFIDEVQNIKIDPFGSEDGSTQHERRKKAPPPVEVGGNIFMIQQRKKKKRLEREQVYSQLWRLFHLVERSKVIIASATPMVNDVNELASHLNLILPLNEQLSDSLSNSLPNEMLIPLTGEIRNINFNEVTLEQLKPLLQGRVSYVRATEVGAVPLYIGQQLNYQYKLPLTMVDPSRAVLEPGNEELYIRNSQLVIDMLEMSGEQELAYRNLLGLTNVELGELERGGGALYGDHRAISSFIFPDGKYGEGVSENTKRERKLKKEIRRNPTLGPNVGLLMPLSTPEAEEKHAYSKYVTSTVQRGTGITFYAPTKEFEQCIANPEWLRTHSIKTFAQVQRAVLGNRELAGDAFMPEESGKRYVYCRTVTGGGAIVKGLCYEAVGFERFAILGSVFENVGGGLRPFCPPEQGKEGENEGRYGRRIRPSFMKKPRYAILSRTTTKTDNQVNAILELFNSPENIDGEYLQVLLVSPVGQYGINLNGVKHVEIDAPEWTPSSLYQARNRAFRATSHTELVERAMRLLKENPDAPRDKIPIEVRVHLYAAVLPPDEEGRRPDTVDLLMYKASEFKDFSIRRTMRMLKQLSFDCQLHRARNIRTNSADGSAECDYEDCNYPCVDPPPIQLDSSTYDVYYYDEIVSNVVPLIRQYFKRNLTATLEQLQREYPGVKSKKYFIFALERMMNEKVELRDRYGYICYIRDDGDHYYLTRSYPHYSQDNDFASHYYSKVLVGIQSMSLTSLERAHNERIVKNWTSGALNLGTSELRNILTNPNQVPNIDAQVGLLEDALHKWVTTGGRTNDATKLIFSAYHYNLMVMEEPNELLSQVGSTIAQGSTVRLRRNPPVPVTFTTNMRLPERPVFIHTLRVASERGTSFSEFIKYLTVDGELRIYRGMNAGGWADLNPMEKEVYPRSVKYYLNSLMAYFQRERTVDGIHGVLVGGRFLVRDVKGQPEGRYDVRPPITGVDCESMGVNDVVDIMWRIGPVPPTLIAERKYFGSSYNETREGMLNFIRRNGTSASSSWEDRRILYYYGLMNANNMKELTKDTMCTSILLWLASYPAPRLFSTMGDPMVEVSRMLRDERYKEWMNVYMRYVNDNKAKLGPQ